MMEILAIVASVAAIIGSVISTLFHFAKADLRQRTAVIDWISYGTVALLAFGVFTFSALSIVVFLVSDNPLTRLDVGIFTVNAFNLLLWPTLWANREAERRKKRRAEQNMAVDGLIRQFESRGQP